MKPEKSIRKCYNHRVIVYLWYQKSKNKNKYLKRMQLLLTREIYLDYETREKYKEMPYSQSHSLSLVQRE